MTYRELAPSAALAPYVDRFWSSNGDGGRILPDGCIDILVENGAARLVGTMTRAIVVPGDAGSIADAGSVVAVRFRPGAAAAFLRMDVDAITDREIELALPIDPRVPRASLEAWLWSRMPPPSTSIVPYIVAQIVAAPATPLDELARTTGYSRQWIARTCRRHIGVSPKQLARVARLQRAVIALHDLPLAQLATHVGYYDQAHMTSDFNDLAGLTPGEARAVAMVPLRSIYAAR